MSAALKKKELHVSPYPHPHPTAERRRRRRRRVDRKKERKKERKNQKTIKRSHAIIVTVFPFDVLTELGHL